MARFDTSGTNIINLFCCRLFPLQITTILTFTTCWIPGVSRDGIKVLDQVDVKLTLEVASKV